MRKLLVIAIFSALLSNVLDGPARLSAQIIRKHPSTAYTASCREHKTQPALMQQEFSISNYCCRSTARAAIGYTACEDSRNLLPQHLPLHLSGGYSGAVLKPPCFIPA